MESEENTKPSEEKETPDPASGEQPEEETRREIFAPVLMAVCLIPVAIWAMIEIFSLVAAPMGIGTEYCYENNFWITSLNGVLISLALVCFFPALVLFGNGVVRIIYKNSWGYRAVLAALFFLPFNNWIAWETYMWYDERDWNTVQDNGKEQLEKLDRDQYRFKGENGTYAAELSLLGGGYGFSERGSVKITGADSKCYTATASHECFRKDLVWDSCNGGLQEQ